MSEKYEFSIGEKVRIKVGAFQNFTARIVSNAEKGNTVRSKSTYSAELNLLN